MCGIFGLTVSNNSAIDNLLFKSIIDELFKLSETRGKEASGLALRIDGALKVYKCALSASELVKLNDYKKIFNNHKTDRPIAAIGHSRLVTNGAQIFNQNNQPVIKKGVVGVHNGIIVNLEKIWKNLASEKRETDLDSEALFALLQNRFEKNGRLLDAVRKTYETIYGMASLAVLFQQLDNLLLTTNNGSIYYTRSIDEQSIIFASEHFILSTLLSRNKFSGLFKLDEIRQLKPGNACLVNLADASINECCLHADQEEFSNILSSPKDAVITDLSAKGNTTLQPPSCQPFHPAAKIGVKDIETFKDFFSSCEAQVNLLKRCTKCLLPETFPFISYDDNGVCNYCNNYQPLVFVGEDKLKQIAERVKRKDGRADCILTFSGGRDSCYGLHYLKKELGLNPLAYTYDWGMITDLARRNQSRLCGKLGVEHILISADIHKKRANIRRNVTAWLKRPTLGTIPLFMAGDKQYFYYANLLMKQNGLDLVVLCENMLETTKFKSGFCGIAPTFGDEHTYSLSMTDKAKMIGFYLKEYALNPAYLNRSIRDTISSFISYYFISHNYLNIYNYLKWDEETVDNVLINEYDWETSPDAKSTWRIGDGTTSFYNYIYYVLAGFTENDTFRSNQIREGMLKRDQALKLAQTENRPRYDSIQWYCDTIGINFSDAIEKINQAGRLY